MQNNLLCVWEFGNKNWVLIHFVPVDDEFRDELGQNPLKEFMEKRVGRNGMAYSAMNDLEAPIITQIPNRIAVIWSITTGVKLIKFNHSHFSMTDKLETLLCAQENWCDYLTNGQWIVTETVQRGLEFFNTANKSKHKRITR